MGPGWPRRRAAAEIDIVEARWARRSGCRRLHRPPTLSWWTRYGLGLGLHLHHFAAAGVGGRGRRLDPWLKANPEVRAAHQERAAELKRRFAEAALPVMPSASHIVPVSWATPSTASWSPTFCCANTAFRAAIKLSHRGQGHRAAALSRPRRTTPTDDDDPGAGARRPVVGLQCRPPARRADAQVRRLVRVIFEFVRVGATCAAARWDAATGVDGGDHGPGVSDLEPLRRLALAKLRRAISQRGP